MSKIPRDLTIEILCRLPVKSLRRFRGVSKEFFSLIDNPDFIKIYLNHSIETGTDLSLIIAGFNDLKIHPLKPDKTTYKVVGSCNGLLALYNHEEGFSLLNKSTKTHNILPKFWEDFKGSFCFYDGFGYDDFTDDYKIVRVMQASNTKHTVVIVYSLKGNSRRVINYIDFPHSFNFPTSQGFGVLVSGSLHWKVNREQKSDTDQLIMAFDIVDEEFREVELPDTTVKDRYNISMGVLRGCLYISCDYEGHVDVWVMKKDDSWTKLCSVLEIQGCQYMKALAYSKNGDKVLIRIQCKNDNVIYCWYDLEKKRLDEGFRFDNYEPKCFYEPVIGVGSPVKEIRVRRLSGVIDPELIPHCVVSYKPRKIQQIE